MSIYTDEGYSSRRDYLEQLADEYGQPYKTVAMMAALLGPDEDFDGLVAMVQDLEPCDE